MKWRREKPNRWVERFYGADWKPGMPPTWEINRRKPHPLDALKARRRGRPQNKDTIVYLALAMAIEVRQRQRAGESVKAATRAFVEEVIENKAERPRWYRRVQEALKAPEVNRIFARTTSRPSVQRI
jgi:hypothetical protein